MKYAEIQKSVCCPVFLILKVIYSMIGTHMLYKKQWIWTKPRISYKFLMGSTAVFTVLFSCEQDFWTSANI